MVAAPLKRLALYWHTLKWLRPVQWRYRLKNTIRSRYCRCFPKRIQNRLLRRIPKNIACRHPGRPVLWFQKRHDGTHGMFCPEDILKGRFTFLNRSKQFDGPVQWKNPEFSYLWDFNLHYFEYLVPVASIEKTPSKDVACSLLENWIESNPCPVQPAWHPYTTSLRSVNWVKFLTAYPQCAHRRIVENLYSQFLFLERNIERHLLGNHVLENGRALVFGGLFFDGEDARRWFDLGLRILKDEIQEEYLPGGGHFERSPMYHCILLEGLLDTYAYLAGSEHDAAWLLEPLRKMCDWLENIRCPDGAFPLFNDAAIGISAAPDEILSHAEQIIGFRRKERLGAVRNCDQFFVLDGDPFFCVVDGAPIGPDYNPGHAHSDNFTYEIFFRGVRLAVDAGTFSYDTTPERVASRSTAAHNTVVINGLEQSEIWGSFRVARRSNPVYSRASQCGDCLVFGGKYFNQVRPRQKISHERIVLLGPSGWVLVWDMIEANGRIDAESRCRFAPGWTVDRIPGGYRVSHTRHGSVMCYPIHVLDTAALSSSYGPEFGRTMMVQAVSFSATGDMCLDMGYLLADQDAIGNSSVYVEREGNLLTIRIDGTEQRISIEGLYT